MGFNMDKWWNTDPAEFARMNEDMAGEYANYRSELEEDGAIDVAFTLAEWLADQLREARQCIADLELKVAARPDSF